MPFDMTQTHEQSLLDTVTAKYDHLTTLKMLKVIEGMLILFGENGDRWTKHAIARDKQGRVCELYSTEENSFCFIGGIRRSGGSSIVECSLYGLASPIIGRDVVSFNDDDETTYKEVKALLHTMRNALTLHRERLTSCQTNPSSHQLRGPTYSERSTTS